MPAASLSLMCGFPGFDRLCGALPEMDSRLSAPGPSGYSCLSVFLVATHVSHTVPNTILSGFASSCNRSSLCIPLAGKPCGTQAECFLLGKFQGLVWPRAHLSA